MSYILDALNKSDQERKQGEVPNLTTIQDHPRRPRSTKRILIYLLVGFLLANTLAIFLWVFFNHPAAPTSEVAPARIIPKKVAAPELIGQIAPVTIEIANQAAQNNQQQAAMTVDTVNQANPQDYLAEDAAAPIAATEILPENEPDNIAYGDPEETLQSPEVKAKLTTFEELPAEIRGLLPDISIAAHYYANNPSARMASINGRVARQGQTISTGLVLDEIIRDGVIFTFRKYRFLFKVFD